jgi:hypothetical protein
MFPKQQILFLKDTRVVKFVKQYPFTDHLSHPNNDADQGAYLSSATNNSSVSFLGHNSLKVKAGWNCKPSGSSTN